MSSKKKGSLLTRVFKTKDGEEEGGGGGAKGKKGKKGKLAKEPSLRESVHSVNAPTMHSVPSSPPIEYDEELHHHGAPVTAVHEENPYSLYDRQSMMMREPSAINVRPPSHAQMGDYFQQQIHDSPRTSVIRMAGHHEAPSEHAEPARHSNVIALGAHEGYGHGEHVAVAGVSRQPTILSPGHSEAPRMLKPGDKMEIDPRNPPTFVIDEGVTLEIGDEETGFIPYEEYLAKLASQPPPQTGGTYIVQGGGDVVIQDESGTVIRTITGTGANAGRGPPQIHEPPHLIPIYVPVKSKPRQRKTEQSSAPIKRQRLSSKARSINSVLTLRKPAPLAQPGSFDILREPVPIEDAPFPSIYQVFTPALPSLTEESFEQQLANSLDDKKVAPASGLHEQQPQVALEEVPCVSVKEEPVPAADVQVVQEGQKEDSDGPAERLQPAEEKETLFEGPNEELHEDDLHQQPPVPTRPLPSPPTATEVSVSDVSSTQPFDRSIPREDSAVSLTGPPMASPASFEEFDCLEDADSDLALFTKPNLHITSALAASLAAHPTNRRDSPVTPIEELSSDMSEVILSPTFRELESRASVMWTSHKRNSSNTTASQQGVYSSPRVSSHTPTTTEPLIQTLISTSIPTPPASRRPSPTLTHSSEAIEVPLPPSSPKPTSPPPRPVRSPRRPSLTSRSHTVSTTTITTTTTTTTATATTAHTLPLPLPPPMAIHRQARSSTMPIPIPQPERPKQQQPRINPSPKILALMQQFEGSGGGMPRDYNDSSISLSLSLSSSRRGSGSSTMLQRMEPMSYSPPSSRPGTPNSLSEFGERLLVEREPISTLSLSREEAATLANGSSKWQLKHVSTTHRDNYAPHTLPRSYMAPAIPGLEIQPSLIRELSQKRAKRME